LHLALLWDSLNVTAFSSFQEQFQRTAPALYELPHPKVAKVLGVML